MKTIDKAGTKRWYNDQGQYHCEHGPAVIFSDGTKGWFINGKRHNENGPAIIYDIGNKYWYLNGIEYTESEWKAKLNPTKELTLEQVINELGYNIKIIK